MVPSLMNKIIIAAILVLSSSLCMGDDDSDIVSGCAMSNAEFGTEMINICINENKTARADLQKYPEEYQPLVERCSRRKEMGWGIVKRCVDDDIAAKPVLEAYGREHPDVTDQCAFEFRGRELSRVKLCVETALKARAKPDEK